MGVTITDESETPYIAKYAYATVPASVVEYNSVNVDVVSGATMTSNAIITAVKDAIAQAGYDVADYQAEIAKEGKEVSLDVDIVIVGAGGSGLTAALEAAQQGANVLVVESNGYAGGTTLFSEGMAVYADPAEEADGQRVLTAQEICDGMKAYGSEYFNETLTLDFLNHTKENVDWLLNFYSGDGIEVSYMPGNYPIHDMEASDYTYTVIKPSASDSKTYFVDILHEAAIKAGAEILLNTTADAILTDENGVTNGIHAVGQNGNIYNIQAKKVILASGGYGANTELMMAHTEMTTPFHLGQNSNKGFGIIATEKFDVKVEYTLMPDIEGYNQQVYSTYGGLVVNENAEVLNTSDEVIENLYAVGELTCVQIIDPYHFVGGENLSWNIYSGRVAGNNAAAALK